MTRNIQAEKAFEYVVNVLIDDVVDMQRIRGGIDYWETGPNPPDGDAKIVIVNGGLFGISYGKRESLPELPLKEIDGVPLLYGYPEVERKDGKLIVYADIISSAFFLLTRYEEVVRHDVRDNHGRFPGKESLPYRAGIIDRPVVDEYAGLLRKWLREVGIDVSEPKRKFSVTLTHDVDSIEYYRRLLQPSRAIRYIIAGSGPLWHLGKALIIALGLSRDPHDNIGTVIGIEDDFLRKCKGLDVEIIYFLLAGGNSLFDGGYSIRSRKVGNLIKQVSQSGARIGLHASYEAGLKPELIANEKKILENVLGELVTHNRHHYLNLRTIEDCGLMAESGIEHDYTLGYADVAGFRLGICRPVQLFDPVKFKDFGIIEHPLLIMDSSLSHRKYMNCDEEQAFIYSKKIIDQVRRHNGELVLLWHNSILISAPGNYHLKLYQKILDELSHAIQAVER
jgi:hypothetical protein